jgi:myo-inositol-1(or 4)-monophosphatase
MATRASELILQHYQVDGLLVESKSDESPVTVADKGAEQLMRQMLAEQYPEDGVLGEEFDDVPSRNGLYSGL